MIYDLVVIGGGAGGCFAAIRYAELYRGAKILILEAARKPLSKVEISGGGRCNVTHACFDPETLIQYYPRGGHELLGPFRRFQPKDIVDWFSAKGVKLKKENDGRMFPVTDRAAAIINCFMSAMNRLGITLMYSTRGLRWEKEDKIEVWKISLMNGQELRARNVLISSGSDQRTWDFLKQTGHTIIDPVPSLFTFNIKDTHLNSLQGISRPLAQLQIPKFGFTASGPLLITHWGLSGPAILKLSAWAARELFTCGYTFDLVVNWLNREADNVKTDVQSMISRQPKKRVQNFSMHDIPARLWKYCCSKSGISEVMNGAEIGNARLAKLINTLTSDTYRVTGKSTFKEEFVTAGGVDLAQIDFQKFESKIISGLFLVGEVLNIDALTGGYNFQAAWTGAEMVAQALAAQR